MRIIKIISCENHESYENHRIPFENHENHENPRIPFENLKSNDYNSVDPKRNALQLAFE